MRFRPEEALGERGGAEEEALLDRDEEEPPPPTTAAAAAAASAAALRLASLCRSPLAYLSFADDHGMGPTAPTAVDRRPLKEPPERRLRTPPPPPPPDDPAV